MSYQTDQDINQDFLIDIRLILKELWNKKLFISIITSIFSIIAVIYSLSLPDVYKSEALLKISAKMSHPLHRYYLNMEM